MSFLVLPPKVRPKGISFQLNALCSVQCLNLLSFLVCFLLSGIIQLFLKFLFVPRAFILSPSQNEARSALPTVLVSHGSQDLLFPCCEEGCGSAVWEAEEGRKRTVRIAHGVGNRAVCLRSWRRGRHCIPKVEEQKGEGLSACFRGHDRTIRAEKGRSARKEQGRYLPRCRMLDSGCLEEAAAGVLTWTNGKPGGYSRG